MKDNSNKALLPEGLQDLLSPDAAREAKLGAQLLACFRGYGYQRVKPPIIEFEVCRKTEFEILNFFWNLT